MPTIAETLASAKQIQQETRITRVKPAKSLKIAASVDKTSSEFLNVRVRINKVPMLFAAGCPEDGPLVIDKNFDRLGRHLSTGYVPKVVVLAGSKALKEAKKSGDTFCAAWVGDKAIKPLSVSYGDAISATDLENKLRSLLEDAYKPKASLANASIDYPYVREIYPFDGYCILSFKKAMYRQAFKIDPKTRNVVLDGPRVQVVQTFVDAPTGDVSSSADAVPFTQGGLVNDTGSDVIRNFGAPGSELNNPSIRMMLNVEEALQQYLAFLKNGFHKPVGLAGLQTPPSLVNAQREVKLAVKAASNVPENFSTMDFLKWQTKMLGKKSVEQFKLDAGATLVASDYAYVGDPRDISTWHLPINSQESVVASMRAAKNCSAVPKFERAEVRERINDAAKSYGIKF